MDSLIQDIRYSLRQLRKHAGATIAAIITLALAAGACTSAFRLIDALFRRPLPIAEPDRLSVLQIHGISDGKPDAWDSISYPLFRRMRNAVGQQAELLAVSYTDRTDLSFGAERESEKVHRQFVSGAMFPAFQLRPALGRLFTAADDSAPGARPYAVLSHDYWVARFGSDPHIIGRTFHLAGHTFEVIGVIEPPFTGTEPGTVTDVFLPMAIQDSGPLECDSCGWMRVLVMCKPGSSLDDIRASLQSTHTHFNQQRAESLKGILPEQSLRDFIGERISLEPAASGVSDFQRDSRRPLLALALFAALVLLIACVNVANLMTIQAAARAREMALRLSIGASRFHLVRLTFIESCIIGALATVIGALFAQWSAPFVVSRINPPDNSARIALPADWRVFGFLLALTLIVILLFGLIPAVRASAIKPITALKGGDDPRSRHRILHGLIAVQVAFCILVMFVASLFIGTFERLTHEKIGFTPEGVLTLDATAKPPQSPLVWSEVADLLRNTPGVRSVALASWPLLSGTDSNRMVFVNGGPMSPDPVHFLNISSGWIDTMNVRVLAGRDFLATDKYPGTALVNEAFAKKYFPGENPVGKTFETSDDGGKHDRFEIVGLLGNTRYQNMREATFPVAYVPFQAVKPSGGWDPVDYGTFVVRTVGENSLALAPTLRQEILNQRPEFHLNRIRSQTEINHAQTVRERLLAMLALFFAVVALLLAGVGLYGVLRYSVIQRQREIAIRIAVGAQVPDIIRSVTADAFRMMLLGVVAGLSLGAFAVRSIESLLYEVKGTDALMLAIPSLTLFVAAALASTPALIQALRIDPAQMLRAE